MMRRRGSLLGAIVILVPMLVNAQELDTKKVDAALGRSGQRGGGAYRVAFPRTDLKVTLDGIEIKPGLALGSWAAFTGQDSKAMVMGDLVLLTDEINSVMEKLRASGFEILALHNHLIGENPRVMYMHYMGHGPAAELAKSLHNAFALTSTPREPAAASSPPPPAPDFEATVEKILDRKGSVSAGVLSFGVPRAAAVTMNGSAVPPAMGLAQSINFQEAGRGKVATTGDFVLTADEVNPVVSALEEHHIRVTALHNHMLHEQPRLFFLHFWSVGSAEEIAHGIRAALDRVAIQR